MAAPARPHRHSISTSLLPPRPPPRRTSFLATLFDRSIPCLSAVDYLGRSENRWGADQVLFRPGTLRPLSLIFVRSSEHPFLQGSMRCIDSHVDWPSTASSRMVRGSCQSQPLQDSWPRSAEADPRSNDEQICNAPSDSE